MEFHPLLALALVALQNPNVSFVRISRRAAGLIGRCFQAETKCVWGPTSKLETRRVATLPTGALLIRTKRDGKSVFYLKCTKVDNIDGRRTLCLANKVAR